jgi:hypothetical protein
MYDYNMLRREISALFAFTMIAVAVTMLLVFFIHENSKFETEMAEINFASSSINHLQKKAITAKENNSQIVGNDRDEHGCIGSAGYSWCEEKKKCLRSWEESCYINIPEVVVSNFYDWYFNEGLKQQNQENLKKFNNNYNLFLKDLLKQNINISSEYIDGLSESHYWVDPVMCTQGVLPKVRTYVQKSISEGSADVIADHDNIKINIRLKLVNDRWMMNEIKCP